MPCYTLNECFALVSGRRLRTVGGGNFRGLGLPTLGFTRASDLPPCFFPILTFRDCSKFAKLNPPYGMVSYAVPKETPEVFLSFITQSRLCEWCEPGHDHGGTSPTLALYSGALPAKRCDS